MPVEIPESKRDIPWVQSLTRLIQEQAGVIQEQKRGVQEQAGVIQAQAEEITQLKTTVQELRDEIARLKKTPKRPKFRPGRPTKKGNQKPTSDPAHDQSPVEASTQKVKEEVIVKAPNVPEGSRFKGYTNYSIQELVFTTKDVTYKLEVWQAPDGSVIRAALPTELQGTHFGSDLRTLIFGLYANGMTQPAIFQFVSSLGVTISKGQIHNILMSEVKGFNQQSQELLSAGLEEAPYIRVDDTGAKHHHQNGYCTHIGGQYFAYYKTTASKSRINFLNILAQGKEGYIINDAFIWHLFTSGVEDDLLNAFESLKGRKYRKKATLNRLLNRMGLKNKKLRKICIEAGLIGFIQETILKADQVLISDRAGQFAILRSTGCWVHMERPLRKLTASTEEVEKEIAQVRKAIWSLYDQVKEASVTQTGKEQVLKAYEALTTMSVNSPGVGEVLNTFRDYREEMLKALEHPGLPLHNNDSERDIRGMVKFRNISGSTKSEEGKSFRDSLMTLKQTCYRLGENFWKYLQAWFRKRPIGLADRIRERYRSATFQS